MFDRRDDSRQPLGVYFNKFIAGHPHLCRAVDISRRGLLAETCGEPELRREAFSLELQLPGLSRSLWIWARCVGKRGRRQAYRFLQLDAEDQRALDGYVAAMAAAPASG